MRPWDYSESDLRGNVIVTLPADHVSVGIPRSGPGNEGRTFNAARVPDGVRVGGFDVGGFEFFPTFVNPSRAGDGFLEVPLQRGREVWLQRLVLDADGQFAIDSGGHRKRETVKVDPEALASAIAGVDRDPGPEGRDARPLAERAALAQMACVALGGREAPARAVAPRSAGAGR